MHFAFLHLSYASVLSGPTSSSSSPSNPKQHPKLNYASCFVTKENVNNGNCQQDNVNLKPAVLPPSKTNISVPDDVVGHVQKKTLNSMIITTMNKKVLTCIETCRISRSVRANASKEEETKIFGDLRHVDIYHNSILSSIMELRGRWSESPIIWADGAPYKIVVVEENQQRTLLYQMYIEYPQEKMKGKKNGYKIINKRLVEITYRSYSNFIKYHSKV